MLLAPSHHLYAEVILSEFKEQGIQNNINDVEPLSAS